MKLKNFAFGIAIATSLTSFLSCHARASNNTNFSQQDSIASDRNAPTIAQVTSVSQLSDVQPTDWAFQALQSLVERYGCISGYPDRTFRGNRALTRYEFAAGLNACLETITQLIEQSTANVVDQDDLATLRRLQSEFEAELATLRGRVDSLEARTAELEANQFSTTTKLVGEAAFTLADTFSEDDDTQTVFHDKLRLQLMTSFTGEDLLITRLTGGNLGNSFADALNTNEGRFAFDGPSDNNILLDRFHYYFPVSDNLKVYTMASLAGHHFYADTLNPGLDVGGGANGALSRFGERNPIYRMGLGGQGLGITYQFSDSLKFSTGYLARGADDSGQGAGLFNGNYSIMSQLVWQPGDRFKLGLTYLNGYDVAQERRFAFGGTGTKFGNLVPSALGIPETGVSSNTYGVQALFDLSDKVSIRGWAGLTKARLIEFGDADIWNYGLVLAFPNLGGSGNFGSVIVGAEPYLTDIDVPGNEDFPNDVPLHVEAAYKYALSDNVFITPGVIWLTAPNQNTDNEDAVIGALRTTFQF